MTFVAVVGALALLNLAAAYPHPAPYAGSYAAPHGCPRPPLPEIAPAVVQSVIPAPVNIGPQAPGFIEHASAPYEINYFEKPWVVKHLKSAALNVFTETPAVVDEYAAPAFSEAPAPPAVIVEAVCGAPAAVAPAPAPLYAPAYASAYAAPLSAPYGLSAPLAAPCH